MFYLINKENKEKEVRQEPHKTPFRLNSRGGSLLLTENGTTLVLQKHDIRMVF